MTTPIGRKTAMEKPFVVMPTKMLDAHLDSCYDSVYPVNWMQGQFLYLYKRMV